MFPSHSRHEPDGYSERSLSAWYVRLNADNERSSHIPNSVLTQFSDPFQDFVFIPVGHPRETRLDFFRVTYANFLYDAQDFQRRGYTLEGPRRIQMRETTC